MHYLLHLLCFPLLNLVLSPLKSAQENCDASAQDYVAKIEHERILALKEKGRHWYETPLYAYLPLIPSLFLFLFQGQAPF